MAGEQTTIRSEQNGAEKLPKEVIISRLAGIVNSEPGTIVDQNQLIEWMSQTGVYESFTSAINTFGQPKKLMKENYTGWPLLFSKEFLFEELEMGEDGQESRIFQARLINSSATFGPALHVYARDGGLPVYGIFLPFTEDGTVDVSRPISGSHYLVNGLYSFSQPRNPLADDRGNELIFNGDKNSRTDEETASVITYATQMAAAQLLFHLEKIQPEKRPEQENEECGDSTPPSL